MDLIIDIISKLFTLYFYLLIIYIFMSWVPNARETQLGQMLANICEPYLEPFRRFIPPLGFVDISPIFALIVLQLAMHGLQTIKFWF
jgi:YggT family protein